MTRPGSDRRGIPVDWERIRERIEALGRTIEGAASLSPEETRSVLEERARALARPLRKEAGEVALELLTFELEGEVYAIESHYVMEVFRRGDSAMLPGAEPPVVGLTAWRGELLPLLNLRQMLGLSASADDHAAQVLVLGENGPSFGVLVGAVQELRETPSSSVRCQEQENSRDRQFVKGMTADAVVVLAAGEIVRTFS